ncbi:DUF397 domain-containing protein [Streptomyces prunicolor]
MHIRDSEAKSGSTPAFPLDEWTAFVGFAVEV